MQTYIVDSFTDKPFSGNPAGVCIVKHSLGDDQMLLVAQELGLSETAFIEEESGSENWSIRFFSPVMEIPLCGHATLGAAAVLFEILGVPEVRFRNVNALILTATSVDEGITLEFPVYETHPDSAPPALLSALGLESVVNVVFNTETNILMLEIEDTEMLASLTPDYQALLASHKSISGVLVTAPSHGDRYDFHSRYFWPWSGTNEDPVTGGTHTFLAKYWSTRLEKNSLRSFQSSSRGGFMDLVLDGDKLFITSHAQIVLAGEMRI